MNLSDWKDIIGYEGLYKIRLIDNIIGCEIMGLKYGNQYGIFNREHVLKPKINKNGYYTIALTKYNEKTKESERKHLKLHRLIAINFIENPNPEKFDQVDHININKIDNRISNLRWVDGSINCQNRKKNKKCSSEYIGVCLKKNRKKYRSCIVGINGKNEHLGNFVIEEEAALKYDEMALHYYGSNAKTNFKIIDGQVIRNV
jgi:hypothetical protein